MKNKDDVIEYKYITVKIPHKVYELFRKINKENEFRLSKSFTKAVNLFNIKYKKP